VYNIMCQKLWKLASSRQSYCKNNQAYFFWPTLYIVLESFIGHLCRTLS